MSTASQPAPSPAGHRPLHWAPVAAAVAVVLALLLAIAVVPPAADEAPRPAASVGAPASQPPDRAPRLNAGVTP